MSNDKQTRIRDLNDAFRQTGNGGTILMTQGVLAIAMKPDKSIAILQAVRIYDDFSPDNDPYGEHDFGAFELGGDTFFWKIDYYAADMIHGSPDASDPDVTTRVMTIMLRSEY